MLDTFAATLPGSQTHLSNFLYSANTSSRQVKEKKKQLKKDGKSLDMEEDDPEMVNQNYY